VREPVLLLVFALQSPLADVALDGVQRIDQRQRLMRGLRLGRAGVEDLAARVGFIWSSR